LKNLSSIRRITIGQDEKKGQKIRRKQRQKGKPSSHLNIYKRRETETRKTEGAK